MSEYLIAHCGRCDATWALEFQPDACTCDTYNPHVDDDVVSCMAGSYTAALDYYRRNERTP